MVDWRDLPFADALKYFADKSNIPTQTYLDVSAADRDFAFTVAGITAQALLQDIRDQVQRAMAQGRTLAEFKADFGTILDRTGWDPQGGRDWRANVIYQQNIRSAYQAGRYQQMTDPALIKARPYWQWRHRDSFIKPRPLHLKWDRMILRADDPWWGTHYPPCGFGCRCTVVALSGDDLERLGRSVDDTPDDGSYAYTDAQGNARTLPNGVDPGFGVAPGKTAVERQRREIGGQP